MLAKSKLNSIETPVSQALTGMEISHEEFIANFKKKDKYEKMQENVRSENEKQEIMRLSSVKPKTSVKNSQKLLNVLKKKKKLLFCVCIKWLILALKHGLKLKFL